jgi:outer membrane protein assembly factor BamB
LFGAALSAVVAVACSRSATIDGELPSLDEYVPFDADSGFKVLWRVDLAELRIHAASPYYRSTAVTSEIVMVAGTDGQLVGLDRATGVVRWRASVGSSDQSPIAPGGEIAHDRRLTQTASSVVIVDTLTQDLIYAVEATTGEVVWSARGRVRAGPASPFAVVLEDSAIRGVDAATGNELWRRTTGMEIAASGAGLVVLAERSPLPTIVAIDPLSGTTLWEQRSPVGAVGSGAIVITSEAVYVSGRDGAVVALRASTGAEMWRNLELLGRAVGEEYPGRGLVRIAAAASDAIYVDSLDHGFLAVSADDGAIRWRRAVPGPVDDAWLSATAVVVAGEKGAIVFDRASGKRSAVRTKGVVNPPASNGHTTCGLFSPREGDTVLECLEPIQ